MMKSMKSALLLSIAAAAFMTPAAAQEAASGPDSATPPTAAEEGETIVVTGSRAANRTVSESPVPVDVLTADALVNTGFTETNRVLNQLVPSFNFPQPAITDGTDVIRPATLRGLGPDQTLVLVNGKRRHSSALLNINGSVGRGTSAVDINLIPSAALARVEVLRDGAAAQYGSDAIAGVINFQLKNAREGGRFSATYGYFDTNIDDVFESGAPQVANGTPTLAPDGTFVLQSTGEKLHVTDGETLTLNANIGLPLGPEGFINVTGEYRDRNATNRTGYDPRRQYGTGATPFDQRELSFDRRSHRYGDPATDDKLVFVHAGLPVGAFELYGFGSWADRNGTSGAFYRLANDNRNVASIYPNGFLPLINSDTDDASGTVGVRGEVGGFNVDLSTSYGHNRFDFVISNTLNASIGGGSKSAFDAGGLRYSQWVSNLDFTRELEVGFVEELNLAFGLEYREEGFRIRAGEEDSYRRGTPPATVAQNNPIFTGAAGAAPAAPGSQGFPGFAPTIGGQSVVGQRSRDNVSAYAEIDASVTEAWTVQIAGRYEDYSDFGSDWNGKIATRLELTDGFALRGAVSTGFRAPSLQQQFYAASATNNVNGVLLETVTLPVDNPVALALGARPLDAETSVSYSAGATLNPVSALNVTVDFYQIDIDDRIVVTENLQRGTSAAGTAIGTILNNAGFTATNAARFFINGIDTRTKGVDVVATYRFDLGDLGNLRATAGYNYNETKITGRNAAPGALAQVPGIQSLLFGRQESLRIERGQPRSKINLGLDFDRDWLGGSLRLNRYGKVFAAGGEIGPAGSGIFNDAPLGAKWITDLELRATPLESVELAIGANNLFDVYPDRVPVGLAGVSATNGSNVFYPTTSYVANYSSFSPFGFNGRFLYVRAGVNF
jgi:iron complex outermembrane receptor protein